MNEAGTSTLRFARGLYLFAFLVIILSPFDFHLPASWSLADAARLSPGALARAWTHVALFIPFGLFLHARIARCTPARAVLWIAAAAAFALLSELAQLFVSRSVSLADLLADLFGLALGTLAAPILPRRLRIPDALRTGRALAVALALLTAGAILMSAPADRGLNTWDQSHPLILGNEWTGDRPWPGEIYGLDIYDSALDDDHARRLSSGNTDGLPAGDDPIARFPLDAATIESSDGMVTRITTSPESAVPLTLVSDGPGPVTPLPSVGIRLESGARLATPTPPGALYARLTRTGAVSFAIQFRAADPAAEGPARIVSLSLSPYERNLTLGQEKDALVLRARNAATGPNGMNPQIVVRSALRLDRPQAAVVVFNGRESRLYLDGRYIRLLRFTRLDRLSRALFGTDAPAGSRLTLPLLAWTAAAALAAGLLPPARLTWLAAATIASGWLALVLGVNWILGWG